MNGRGPVDACVYGGLDPRMIQGRQGLCVAATKHKHKAVMTISHLVSDIRPEAIQTVRTQAY